MGFYGSFPWVNVYPMGDTMGCPMKKQGNVGQSRRRSDFPCIIDVCIGHTW